MHKLLPFRQYDEKDVINLFKLQGNASKFGSFYPEAPMALEASTASSGFLGITLRSTLAYDENDEKLSSYPVKKDELQAVLPGEAVPVVTRGFFTLTGDAVTGAAVGNILTLGANGTFLTPANETITVDTSGRSAATDAISASSSFGVGRVLAVGAAGTTKPAAIFVQLLGSAAQ